MPLSIGKARCDTLLVQLPVQRGGCDGDTSYELQLQPPDSHSWIRAPGNVALIAPTEGDHRRVAVALVPMLDAHSAYKLRLIAHNAQGVAASDVAGPFFTGLGARSIMAQYVVKRVASGVF